MKFYTLALSLVLGINLNAQVQEKKQNPSSNTIKMEGRKAAPNLQFKRADPKKGTISINGNYVVDSFDIQLKEAKPKQLEKQLGNILFIADTTISGENFETILYKISHTEELSTEDYLYRVFGEVPAEVPSNLPENLQVIRTNNLACYGIGLLPNGGIVIPYKGALLYLKRERY